MRPRFPLLLPGLLFFAGLLGPAANIRAAQAAVATPDTSPSETEDPAQSRSSRKEKVAEIVRNLQYRQGEVTLKDGLAKLSIPQTFRFLGTEDAEKVLHDLWGNPPRSNILGMLLPSNVGPDQPESWAVVIDYEEEGYIKDGEADKINYTTLLKEMQESSREANKQRVAEGYPAMELVGWATPPRYDKVSKKMYWAKELKVAGADEDTLNYNIRILGRRGVLVLNAVAGMSQLPEIERAAPDILSMVDFKEGHRYADFNPKTDKVAAYGVAALVAGGVAAKMGLFKVVWIAVLAAKKFVIIGVVAVVGFLKRIFGGKKETPM